MSEQSGAPVQRTEEEREFDAITPSEIWAEARDRLKISTDAESRNRPDAKKAIEFREGDQWDANTGGSISEDEPELVINLTDALCMRVENNLRQQRPRGKCHPIGDGADVELAELINGIGRHVETRSEASVAYDMAASCALTAGWGYFRLIAEYVSPRSFQKDLRILPIRNIFTVNMDPSAIMPAGQDQNWCLISSKMRRTEYKRRYPRLPNVNWTNIGAADGVLDWEDAELVRLAEYFRIRELPEMLYQIRAADGSEMTKYQSELPRHPDTGKFDLDHVVALLAATDAKLEGKRQSIRRGVEWFRLNGTMVIERQQLPGSYIPVFRVEDRAVDIDGDVIRRGMVKPMMDPQRMVNYGEVAKIKRLGLAPKAPWIGAEGQFEGRPEWDNANQKAYSKLEYKPIVIETSQGPMMVPPPSRQAPAQIEAGFSEFVQGMRSNLMGVAGAANEPGQDQQGVVVSGRAIDRRQFLSDQAHFHVYDNLTLAIAQLWRVMLEWIPAYYTEERMQRCIGDDGQPQMVAINTPEEDPQSGAKRLKNDLSVGRYDVVMDTGPGYETRRAEGAQNLIDMVKIGPLAEIVSKVAPDLLFRSIDHPYMQELADRLSANTPDGLKKVMEGLSSRARSLVQSLANENAQLKQQLQTLQTDLKYGITKAHLAATVKAHDTNVAADTKLKDSALWADEQRNSELLKMAGKMIDAGAIRGHEAGMFETQIMHEALLAAADRTTDAAVAASSQPAAEPAAAPADGGATQ